MTPSQNKVNARTMMRRATEWRGGDAASSVRHRCRCVVTVLLRVARCALRVAGQSFAAFANRKAETATQSQDPKVFLYRHRGYFADTNSLPVSMHALPRDNP